MHVGVNHRLTEIQAVLLIIIKYFEKNLSKINFHKIFYKELQK